jgi:hypothetical protein
MKPTAHLNLALNLVRQVRPLDQGPDEVQRRLGAVDFQVEAALVALWDLRETLGDASEYTEGPMHRLRDAL